MSFEAPSPSVILSEPKAGWRNPLGAEGEALARQYLEKKGMRILQCGFRIRGGEIDLIAEDGDELVFVEVKTRSSTSFGDPLEAVTPTKCRRIIRAASVYLHGRGEWDRPCRFDLVAIRQGAGGRPSIEHLTGAFTADRFRP